VQFDEAERVRFAAEAAGIGTWDWDLDRDVITCSKTCASLHGARTGEALKYRDFNALLHEDDREWVEAAFSAAMATGVLDVEYRVVRTGGGSQWLWCKPSESMKRTLGIIARLRRRELHSRLLAPCCL